MEALTLKTPQFEGPLELLLALVQNEEIPICDIEIYPLLLQIQELLGFSFCLHQGAESISFASRLLLMKSRKLLPSSSIKSLEEEEAEGLNLPLMEKLVEYCRFKEAALSLAQRETGQEAYTRFKLPTAEIKKPLGIDHLSLADLASIFEKILEKAVLTRGTIENEEWQIADKITWIGQQLVENKKVPFETLFSLSCSKLELIVIFLALLEMMKSGLIQILKDNGHILVSHV